MRDSGGWDELQLEMREEDDSRQLAWLLHGYSGCSKQLQSWDADVTRQRWSHAYAAAFPMFAVAIAGFSDRTEIDRHLELRGSGARFPFAAMHTTHGTRTSGSTIYPPFLFYTVYQ